MRFTSTRLGNSLTVSCSQKAAGNLTREVWAYRHPGRVSSLRIITGKTCPSTKSDLLMNTFCPQNHWPLTPLTLPFGVAALSTSTMRTRLVCMWRVRRYWSSAQDMRASSILVILILKKNWSLPGNCVGGANCTVVDSNFGDLVVYTSFILVDQASNPLSTLSRSDSSIFAPDPCFLAKIVALLVTLDCTLSRTMTLLTMFKPSEDARETIASSLHRTMAPESSGAEATLGIGSYATALLVQSIY